MDHYLDVIGINMGVAYICNIRRLQTVRLNKNVGYKNVFGQKSENYGKWSEMKISEDMLEVAKRYLKHEKTEKIIWNSFKTVGHEKTQSGEDLHILT